jgi:mannose-6-phosphate isomerase-like protein (cupin superfamily)
MNEISKIPTISEEEHRAAEEKIRLFSYKTPDLGDRKRATVCLVKSDLVRGLVGVAKEGGETNLHYHTTVDAFWMVLRGRAKFYGPGDVLIGEFGMHEGLVMPRNARYWFESVGDETLEILFVQAFDKPQIVTEDSGRTDASPRKRELASQQGVLSAER